MLLSELIVTDGLFAYCAHTFSSRYTVDPAEEWVEVKKRKRLVFGILFITSIMSTYVVVNFARVMCFTSEGAQDWVITTCPLPPENVAELLRVWGGAVN